MAEKVRDAYHRGSRKMDTERREWECCYAAVNGDFEKKKFLNDQVSFKVIW